jgi:hypothetical protein
MKAHIYLGESYRLIRNGNIAKNHYEKAQEILQSIQDEGRHAKLQEGMILLGLGRIYLKEPTQLHRAEDFLNRSLQMHYQLGEELMVAAVQNELGELHIATEEFDQALNFLVQSRHYFEHVNADFYYLSCQASLCKCYYAGRDYFKDRKIYSNIYEIVKDVKNVDEIQMQTHLAKIKLVAGRASIEEEKVDAALSFYCESMQHAVNFNQYVCREIWDGLAEDISALSRNNKNDVAMAILHRIRQCIEQATWTDEQNQYAQQLLEKVKAKEKEIKTLVSHTQKSQESRKIKT